MTGAPSPSVSVILPTFNRARWLERSIQSVLGQTYPDFELIVVDDGSTDETGEVLGRFTDPRVHRVRHTVNRGVGAARNTGLQRAFGEFLAFMDDDVEWFPHKLARVMSVFPTLPTSVGAIYHGAWMVGPTERWYNIFPDHSPQDDLHSLLLEIGGPGTPRLVVRRSSLTRVGPFDGRLRNYDDWDLCIRLSKHYAFWKLDEPLASIDLPEGRLAVNRAIHLEATDAVLANHWDEYLRLGKRHYLASRLVELGHHALELGWVGQGRRWLWKALRVDPVNAQALGRLALSLLGAEVYRRALYLRRRLRRQAS